ncbi:hypothetical protein CYMTET_6277 [Cymbomonas tetramitiformis]|uniref:Glycosyltransferase 61 catalytic domain-containing protein n=1 Tax=Cymbomonas tetramitiformis TaxID=36881 RepID=A0AAE0GXF4_9CHLO|nr:hypothetical protein CYMTET_6277 [Cymbomonas tetramitiformis]
MLSRVLQLKNFVDALVPFFTYLQEISEAMTVFVAPRASRLGWVGAMGVGRLHKLTDGWTLGILQAMLSHHCQEHKQVTPSDIDDGQLICGKRVDLFLYSCEDLNTSRQSSPFLTSNSLPKLREAVLLDFIFRYQVDLSARWHEADKVLFYSRKDSRRRFVTNDVEILTALTKATESPSFGQVVDLKLTGLTYEEQAYQFSAAKVFICPFGAHAVNAVFMKPGSVIFELYPGCGIDGGFAEHWAWNIT